MNFGQLLDRSPQIRAQLAHLMGLVDSSRQGRRKAHPGRRTHSLAANTAKLQIHDHADNPHIGESTVLGYLEAHVDSVIVRRCMIDCGSLSELVSPDLVRRLGLKKSKIKGNFEVKMADDSTAPVTHYVCLPLLVHGILSIIRAYIIGNNNIYNLLLSKYWLYRIKATINYRSNMITMTGSSGYEVTTSLLNERGRPLTDTFEDSNSDTESNNEEEFIAEGDIKLTYSLLADELTTAAELQYVAAYNIGTNNDGDSCQYDRDTVCGSSPNRSTTLCKGSKN